MKKINTNVSLNVKTLHINKDQKKKVVETVNRMQIMKH
jgi:hypothetical protein